MSNAIAVIDAARFNQDWPEDPDLGPPPGKDFAAALVSSFASTPNCSVLKETVADDDWEHSAWFFWVRFGDAEFTVYLECTPVPETLPGRWLLSLVRERSLLKALFGRPASTELPASIQHVIEGVLKRVAHGCRVRWVSDQDIESALCG